MISGYHDSKNDHTISVTQCNWLISAGRPTVISFSLRCFGLHQHRHCAVLSHWQLLGSRFCIPGSAVAKTSIRWTESILGLWNPIQSSYVWLQRICFDLLFHLRLYFDHEQRAELRYLAQKRIDQMREDCSVFSKCNSWKCSRYGTALLSGDSVYSTGHSQWFPICLAKCGLFTTHCTPLGNDSKRITQQTRMDEY